MMNKIAYYKWEIGFALSIPVINALGGILAGLFPAGLTNPGNLRAYLIFIFIIYFFLKRFNFTSLNRNLIFFLIFIFLLIILFSTDKTKSIYIYFKFFLATSVFFVGYYYARIPGFFKKLNTAYFIALSLYLLNLLLSNMLQFGDTSYKGIDDVTYFGTTGVNVSKNIVSIILIFPLLKYFNSNGQNKKIWIILMIAGVIAILIAFKRTPILSLFFGFLIYFLLAPKKTKALKTILIGSFLLILISPLYLNKVEESFNAREDAIRIDEQKNLEKQGRYQELNNVLDAYKKGSARHKLLGSEFYNDSQFYDTERMIHTDYMSLLSGTGLIGLSWFLVIYYLMFSLMRSIYRHNNSIITGELYAVGTMAIVNSLILGIAGTIPTIEPRSLIFMYLGAIIGLMKQMTAYNANKNRI